MYCFTHHLVSSHRRKHLRTTHTKQNGFFFFSMIFAPCETPTKQRRYHTNTITTIGGKEADHQFAGFIWYQERVLIIVLWVCFDMNSCENMYFLCIMSKSFLNLRSYWGKNKPQMNYVRTTRQPVPNWVVSSSLSDLLFLFVVFVILLNFPWYHEAFNMNNSQLESLNKICFMQVVNQAMNRLY